MSLRTLQLSGSMQEPGGEPSGERLEDFGDLDGEEEEDFQDKPVYKYMGYNIT